MMRRFACGTLKRRNQNLHILRLLKPKVIFDAELRSMAVSQESSGCSAGEGCFGHKLYNTCMDNENSHLADAYQRRH